MRAIASAWADVFDANSLFILGRAMEAYDITRHYDRIKVPVLYVLSRTDALFPPGLAPGVMASLKAAGVDAQYFEIDSDHGHLASRRRRREVGAGVARVHPEAGGEGAGVASAGRRSLTPAECLPR